MDKGNSVGKKTKQKQKHLLESRDHYWIKVLVFIYTRMKTFIFTDSRNAAFNSGISWRKLSNKIISLLPPSIQMCFENNCWRLSLPWRGKARVLQVRMRVLRKDSGSSSGPSRQKGHSFRYDAATVWGVCCLLLLFQAPTVNLAGRVLA